MGDQMKENTSSRLAVIESKWNNGESIMRKNASVKPMFDMLCDLHFESLHDYSYEMVATSSALDDAIKRMAWDRDIATIYIAAHGGADGIHLHGWDREVITRKQLSKMLLQGGTKRTLKGVYLGSCEFGNRELAEYLLSRDKNLQWVAGYSSSADFIDGTALDIMFFNYWFGHLSKEPEMRPRDLVELVAEDLKERCNGMINTPAENGYGDDDDAPGMGFSIFVRSKGRASKVIDLIREY